MKPYAELPASVWYEETRYELDLSYAAFYAALDALNDRRLMDAVRLETALDILVRGPHPADPGLLSAIIDLIKDDKPPSGEPKRLDIEQDWEYICAAFQQAYGIDLYTDKTIHILRFRALLESVPKSTKLAEIVGIRAADIPKPTKYNAQEIANLTRLKAYYALKGDTRSLQDGWARLFEMLEARAK